MKTRPSIIDELDAYFAKRRHSFDQFDDLPTLIEGVLTELHCDVSKQPPESLPDPLVEFLGITTPEYRDALLFELTAPLAFKKQLFVNVVTKDSINALNTINEMFGALYGNLIEWRGFQESDDQFLLNNAYLVGKRVVIVYTSGKARKFAEFVESPILQARSESDGFFTIINSYPVILSVDNVDDLPDPGIMKDAVVIPIVDTVVGKKDPHNPLRTVTGIYLNDDAREAVLLWLAYNVLPRFLNGEVKKYVVGNGT